MNMLLKLLFMMFFVFLNNIEARYVCTHDQIFKDWLNQIPVNVADDVAFVKYSDLTSCKSQCKNVLSCVSIPAGGFTCPLYDSNVNMSGDLGLNSFSTLSGCNNQCFQQYSCMEWANDPKCTPTALNKSNPVSDWTGKTVFTKYDISWNCTKTEVIHGECLAYSTQRIDDNRTYDLSKIGWKSKAFTSPDEAMTAVAGMDQLQHVWSGWNGMCESGYMIDNSWMADPVTLLSYAMMTYSGALQGAYGSTMQQGAGAIKDAGTAVSKTFDSMTSFGKSVASGGDGAIDGAKTVSSTIDTAKSTFSSIKDTQLIGATSMTTAVTAGSAVMDAAVITMAAMSEPTGDDLQIADDFMKAQLGATNASMAAVNYTQCMASIGLSFPNMVGFAVDDNSSTSAEMREPWKNIITLSDNQLAGLMLATSQSFVRGSYLLVDHSGDIGHYIATSSVAYTQAGQVMCGNGTIARAININNQVASNNSGGVNTSAMASAVVGQALSYLPPPYNLISGIALKMLTSVSQGNACTNEDIAMKWGEQQFKTNKALAFGQCHQTGSGCAAKYYWGDCMRTRKNYCCYDQEMTRIFVEGAKIQLSKPWVKNSCDDIALEDLKNIAFRKCLSSENPATDKCFPEASWLALNDVIKKQTVKGFDASSLTNMAVDAMPIGNDPWGARTGD